MIHTTLYALLLAAATQPGSVLLILADDIGAESLGFYGAAGSKLVPTPNLDRLAATGLVFDNCWANPLCSATRAGIMTGRHAIRTRVGDALHDWTPDSAGLQARDRTLPELLRDHAPIAQFGKWHLGNAITSPNEIGGWPVFAGSIVGTLDDYYEWEKVTNGAAELVTQYETSNIVDDAVAWIETQQAPWFCWTAYSASHAPYHIPPPELHTYDLEGLDPNLDSVAFYQAATQALDTELGRLLRSLDLAETTVIFTVDNGISPRVVAPPDDPGKVKGTLYQPGVRVPLVIAGAAVSQRGRVGGLVHTIDLFPTILELMGRATPPGIDGVSMTPYLANPSRDSIRETVYTEWFYRQKPILGDAGARDRRYKLIRHRISVTLFAYHLFSDELYNLENDPLEQDNLLKSPLTAEAAAAYARLKEEVEAMRRLEKARLR